MWSSIKTDWCYLNTLVFTVLIYAKGNGTICRFDGDGRCDSEIDPQIHDRSESKKENAIVSTRAWKWLSVGIQEGMKVKYPGTMKIYCSCSVFVHESFIMDWLCLNYCDNNKFLLTRFLTFCVCTCAFV